MSAIGLHPPKRQRLNEVRALRHRRHLAIATGPHLRVCVLDGISCGCRDISRHDEDRIDRLVLEATVQPIVHLNVVTGPKTNVGRGILCNGQLNLRKRAGTGEADNRYLIVEPIPLIETWDADVKSMITH